MDESIIDTHHGLGQLLASIIVVLCLHLIVKVGQVVWDLMAKKNELSEQSVAKLTHALDINTHAVEKLQSRIQDIEQELAHIAKFKIDLKRVFQAVKILAKDVWPDIRKEIMEDVIE